MSLKGKRDLCTQWGYAFKDETLLTMALTHVSVSRKESYERLEFLGDRILGAIIADCIYRTFPEEPEGSLAKRYARLVSAETLAQIALVLGLPEYLILARGEHTSGGRRKKSILADACEALIGALYLDGGLEIASTFVLKYWSPLLKAMDKMTPPIDSKTELQECSQALGKGTPSYVSIAVEGPQHDPLFTSQVNLEGYPSCQGRGKTKRIAEQKAAEALLKHIKDFL